MNVTQLLGRLLGLENVERLETWRASFAGGWAQRTPWLVALACLAALAVALTYYLRAQRQASRRMRWTLGLWRAALLCLLVLILAEPVLELRLISLPKPDLWLVLDGTDSMSIADQSDATAANGDARSRADHVRESLAARDYEVMNKLADRYQVKLFSMDRSSGVTALAGDAAPAESEAKLTPDEWQKRLGGWKTKAEVSSHGHALEDLTRRHSTNRLAGVVFISDFDQNAGPAPVQAATQLGVPIFAVGVGAVSAVDLSVDLLVPPTMKKGEGSTLSATVRQRELEGTRVRVKLTAHPVNQPAAVINVGEREATLLTGSTPLEFPFTPEQTGRLVFTAEVDAAPGESVVENNTVSREGRVIDDFLRLMYVEYEPTWEWRFVKEVFHRDRLVGLRGFRTYLRSADPAVRQSNELFLPSLTLPRSEFFESDVIFLGDMPASALSTRFCEMTREFVSKFGGGLVVMAGPRFGPGELAETPLADMLPVVVDPDAQPKESPDFAPRLTAMAGQFDFMRLGEDDKESLKAWTNMGKFNWYQPALRVEPRATTVLAEHPTDTCTDGKTPQPLIAIRKYGRGEVVYVASNEMWRLRRLHGEKYYRQYWGQLIHRLGLSHALGSQKRFVVRTDKKEYRGDEKVLVTVEAYDKNFEPLTDAELPDKRLTAELIAAEGNQVNSSESIAISQLRPGIFETRLGLTAGGEYRLRVQDPVLKEAVDVSFTVANQSAERRSALRNASLQQNIAAASHGKAYELDEFPKFLDEFDPPKLKETSVVVVPLWSTWLCFGVVVTLMLGEWLLRKVVHLP